MKKILLIISTLFLTTVMSATQYKISINEANYKNSIVVEKTKTEPNIENTSLTFFRSYYNDYTKRVQTTNPLLYNTEFGIYSNAINYKINNNNVLTFSVQTSLHGTGVFNGYVLEGFETLSSADVLTDDISGSGSVIVTVKNNTLYINMQGVTPVNTTKHSITMKLTY
jgi:hypothetical protein